MRSRALFSLLAIVVFGLAGWAGPAFAIANFDTSISGSLSTSVAPAPGGVTTSTPPVTVTTSGGASATGNNDAQTISDFYVSTHVQGNTGVVLPSSATADIIATIDVSIAVAAGGQPLVIQLLASNHSQIALAPVPGESASTLSELTLSYDWIFASGGPNGPASSVPLYHEQWTLVAGGSPIGGVDFNNLSQPLVPIPGVTGVTLHWSAHSHGEASANAVASAPVPPTLALLGSGLTALGTLAWRRRR